MQVELNITAFGFEHRHVKINMKTTIPRGHDVGNWVQRTVLELCKDVKHSGKWLCFECGKPARAIQLDILSYLHLPKPELVIYVHQLCENQDGPCDRAAKAESDIWRKEAGAPPNPPNSTRRINPVQQPMSRSCASCHPDPFESPEVKLRRCGRCKLIRYVGLTFVNQEALIVFLSDTAGRFSMQQDLSVLIHPS
ncbi:hypothetical protein C8R44DRAFT_318147 [Mycena epipterygia]|nr:hypothetical protein C8R44DRAFT_318147 [Mycena epipterygia]